MALSIGDLVDTIAALYAPPPNYFDLIQITGGIYWGIRREAGADLVVCRGSVDPQDWWRDLTSETSRVVPNYPSIGHVPYGFGEGLPDAYKAIRAASATGVQTYFLGHSLGAAHTAELAGMWAADQSAIAGIVLCGCPKPGMVALSTLLASREVPITNLRNGKDPVPDVPAPLPPLLEWRDLAPFTVLDEAPDPNAPQSAFAQLVPDATWHNITLYQKGAHALST